MRDYLYIWSNPADQYLIASGVEFRDIATLFESNGGLVLLEHQTDEAATDANSSLDYLNTQCVSRLKQENIYSWGNFVFADFADQDFPKLPKQEVAELLYFQHTGDTFGGVALPCLRNRFLISIHDDGWYLKVYYTETSHALTLLQQLPLLAPHPAVIVSIVRGQSGYWVASGVVDPEPCTHDIDSVLNRRLRRA